MTAKAEIYPPRPTGTPVLSFFYSGGTPVGGASPPGDIKTPLHELPLPMVPVIAYLLNHICIVVNLINRIFQ